ncbi:MAG TPA: universal stress protein [Egibacteraceae bacterium]|nr:universal stress protein [Egibacteraceae bacterium]
MSGFPQRVLVGVDVDAASDRAVETAVQLCARSGGELHLAHVKLTHPSLRGRSIGSAQADQMRSEAETLLARHADRVDADSGVDLAGRHVRFSRRIEDALVDLAAEIAADLVVVGTGKAGDVGRRLIGALGRPVPGEVLPAVLVVRHA